MSSISAYGEVSLDNGPMIRAELKSETEMIDVTCWSATKPDMDWEYVDGAGHFHAYDRQGELPTLKSVEEVFVACGCEYCDEGCVDDDGELHTGYTTHEYRCELCNELVKPARVPDMGSHRIPGLTSWTVIVYDYISDDGRRRSVRFVSGKFTAFGFGLPIAFWPRTGDCPSRTRLECWPMSTRPTASQHASSRAVRGESSPVPPPG